MTTYAFGPVVGMGNRHGDRLESVPMAVTLPPRAPFFSIPGETSRFPPRPLPPGHGAEVAP